MARMSEDELRAITDGEMRQAVGYWSGKLAMQRQRAMWYYLGLAKEDLAPPEIEGRSSVVSPDVRNTIESMLPQLMVKFAGSDTVVEFVATKPGDEQKAEQATDYINHLYYVDNPGESITYTWMKDALISKNGIVKVWWDDRYEEKREEYTGMTEPELALLASDEQIELIESRVYPDPEDEKQRQQALEQLQSLPPEQAAPQIAQIQQTPAKLLYDVTAIRKEGGGRCRVENVPPEEFLISRKAKSIKTAPFVGHRVARTLSELKSQGYKDKDLEGIGGDDNATALNMERIERLSYDDELAWLQADSTTPLDESQRIVWVTECYIRVDFDGDGITELRKVVRAGNKILENEIVDCAPFVSICPIPMPHKFFGLSVADLAMEGQRVNTAILRASLDNLYTEVNGRHYAVEGQVNLDDLLASRPGGVVRVKNPQAVGRLEQGMGNSQFALTMLEYMKGFQEDATGWTRYNQGLDGDTLNKTATGVTQLTSRADMRLDLIARNFAEGFRELFRMLLKLVCQYQQKERVISLRGSWVPINPREWINGFEATVNVGLGTGNKDQQVGHLMALLQQQQFGLQVGTAIPANVYEAQSELAKALGYRSADKFFTDPRKMQPQEPPPPPEVIKAQSAVQLKQMELTADAQRFQAEMQAKMQELQMAHQARMAELQANLQLQASNDERDATREAMRQQLEAQKQEADAQLKREIAELQAQVDKYKADMDASVRLALAEKAAAPAIDLGPLQASIQSITEMMQAPAEIVRDPKTGKAIGIKRGELIRPIQRGPDGRATGIQ